MLYTSTTDIKYESRRWYIATFKFQSNFGGILAPVGRHVLVRSYVFPWGRCKRSEGGQDMLCRNLNLLRRYRVNLIFCYVRPKVQLTAVV